MTTPIPSGLDHNHYLYRKDSDLDPLVLPNGASLAVWITLYFEHWDLDTRPGSLQFPGVQGPWQPHEPDYRTFTYRDYGNRVGVFRIIELLDDLGVPVTVAANAAAIHRRPATASALAAREYEFACHGISANQIITSALSPDDEASVIEESRTSVADFVGIPPLGWIGQEGSESSLTPDLVASAGFSYLADWPNDDGPYRLTTNPRLVSLPLQPDWDDMRCMWMRSMSPGNWRKTAVAALDYLSNESQTRPRTFNVTIHPWLVGRPSRFPYLRLVLEEIMAYEGVWVATGGQIAAQFAEYNDRERDGKNAQ